MVAFATLGGQFIQSATLFWPQYGQWIATDIITTSSELLFGKQTLTIGDVSMVGGVSDGGISEAQGCYEVIAGHEWNSSVPKRPYQADGGIKLSTVLSALASDCGGTVVLPPEASLGRYYTRPAGQALARIVALRAADVVPQWRIDDDGRLTFGIRESGEAGGGPRAIKRDLACRAARVVYSDSIKQWIPGGTFEGNRIRYTRITLSARDISIDVGW